uniref:interferon-inducible protein AIM2 n=1 Tax=Jaculus jaculus TaxID=51337 RepID=UPI001E1B48B1|nr:interferon-inducible protein AIM2 [Jaculus jaculus]XP_044987866.1 interferon-inducible protein AIM2 [Jaculus jaculus]XP_044987870.1 interferon-inducible protein AIM2 [Jaculus jaculus]XP_044987877.1 interferon-inducible protein AIM2 [Jaculus jaculus]XP_044987882.1 interferon-inducible protein AIM2 [Jaculus jaculus]XP_044987888.1 interferon-inducible protein AIM2 [Jaculus jaculus]
MESRYKEILLLVGLDNITDEELQRFKFFLPDEFTIAKGKLEAANRPMLANLMIQNQGVKFAVTKTIALFRKLNYMHVATSLEEEKQKVDNAFMINEREKDPKIVKKKSEAEMCSMAPAPSRSDVSKLGATPEASPPTQPEKKALVVQQGSLRECLKKESLTVLVLKAMKPFKFQTQEGEQEMFHATVATETDFFFVKVFNTQLKDKFVSRRIIVISQYYQHRDYLEVNSSSIVSDANSDQKVSVPQSIIRKAGETPKISKLQTQPPGTVVNGVFVIQKKTERKDSVLFDLNDNTGRMKALVLGNQSKVPCAKGDKLRLTFFEVSKSGEKLQLTSGVHSLIKVIKAKK